MLLLNVAQLGQIIRQTRKSQGLTQEDLAAISGLGRRFIIELESGKESCHLGKTLLVLQNLGIQLNLQGLPEAVPPNTGATP